MSSTGMTPFVVNSLLLYGLAAILNGYKLAVIALFTIIRTDRNMLLACYSHKQISYRIRTIIRKAILYKIQCNKTDLVVINKF
ncbi:hypothetical protein [Wolbachia endosymbiont of Glossina morsitans morsitans]|uniref:hypothetical protein n=1 Tax=Wolbachia endosymbiont of Glossina morsitans morsitans TaxID=1150948 RepID=UPI000FE14B0E|nr:hypothetical protein [Wolbachia endosymbiont of Glossina morsitans morsitans]